MSLFNLTWMQMVDREKNTYMCIYVLVCTHIFSAVSAERSYNNHISVAMKIPSAQTLVTNNSPQSRESFLLGEIINNRIKALNIQDMPKPSYDASKIRSSKIKKRLYKYMNRS